MPSGVYPGNKGKKLTPEHKAKLSAAHKGLVPSEETCMKMSETNKKTWKKKIAAGYESPQKGKRKSRD